MADFLDESFMMGTPPTVAGNPSPAPANVLSEDFMTGIKPTPPKSSFNSLGVLPEKGLAGLDQMSKETKAITNMLVGMPGGIAGVGMDILSRVSDLLHGVGTAKQAGVNARAVSDQVNSDWSKLTGALGLSQDASGSKIEHLMNKGIEATDELGASGEAATGGIVSKETMQSVRDTLLNALGVKGIGKAPAGRVAPLETLNKRTGKTTPSNWDTTATALTAEQAVQASKARIAAKMVEDASKPPLDETPQAKSARLRNEVEKARIDSLADGTATPEAVTAVVEEALANQHPLDKAWSAKKAEAAPGTSPTWDNMVRTLVEPEEIKARRAEPPYDPRFPPQDVPKARIVEPTVLGEAPTSPDLVVSGLDKLRNGLLISSKEAKAIRDLKVRPGEEAIVGPDGKSYYQRGAVDPALLKVLGLMGLGAVAGTALYNWFQSPSGLSGDNARDVGMGLAGLGAAGVVKGKGGMWHPETGRRMAGVMAESLQRTASAELLDAVSPTDWATKAVTNYFNKHAGTATDPVKDLRLPDGTKIEDITDAMIVSSRAGDWYQPNAKTRVGREQNAMVKNVPPEEPIYEVSAIGKLANDQYAARKFKEYLGHVGDYLASLNLTPEKLQQMDLPRAIRETVANDKRIAEMALRDVTRPNPTKIADTQALPVYKEYPPVKSGPRKFSFNKDGSLSQLSSVELPAGDVQYSWREIKKPDSLTPEQMKRIRPATEAEINEVARGDSSLDVYDLQDQGLLVALDEKGNLLRDNFSKSPAAGDTPETAHLAGQLAQEGNSLGHCVGGYVDQVLQGESRIISLRDQHGRSYATVELNGDKIAQIKGPGNGAPADYVKPYVQDFVKSGKWSSALDLDHAGLVHDKYYNDYVTPKESAVRELPALREQVADLERLKRDGGYGRRGWTLDRLDYELETARKNLAESTRMAAQEGKADVKLLAKIAGGAAAAAYLMSDKAPDDKLTLAAMGLAGSLGLRGKFEGVSEPHLIEIFRKGGREGEAVAAKIYEDTHRQLERSIANMGKDLPVEDIAQQTYEKAFRSLKLPETDERAFRGGAKLSTYLHAIAKNETLNSWSKNERSPQTESMTVDPETGASSAPEKYMMQQSPEKYQSAQDQVATNQMAKKMQDALDKLPPDQRAVFDALEMEGLSYEEAAQALNVPIGTIRSRFSRAKENLQGTLREYKDLQAGKIDEGLLKGAGLVGGGALAGAMFSDDPQRGAVIGGMLGLGGLVLGSKAADTALGRSTTRLMHILPELRRGIRDMEMAASKEISAASDAITAFIKPASKLAPIERMALDKAYTDANGPAMQVLVSKHPELAKGYTRVREFLKEVESSLIGFGRFKEGLPDYLPLLVKDYKGLMATLDTPVRDGLQNMLHKANVKMIKERGRELSDTERSMLLNDYLLRDPATSFQPGYAKTRRLKIADETRPFYHTLEDALIHYGHAAVSDLQTAKFFGKDLRTSEAPGGKRFTNVESSIGALVNRALTEGKMTPEQAAEVKGILRARFVEGEMSPQPWLQDVRNLSGAALLGQIGSGLVQTSEALLSTYHHGVKPAADALGMILTGRGIKPSEFGLANHVIEEVIGKRPSGQLLSALLKVNLLATLDQVGISQNLTASFLKNKRLVETPQGIAKLTEKWAADYGPDFPQLLKELQTSTRTARTPLVDSLLYQELSDLRPTSRSEAPQLYNAHPDARMAYHLKQFMLTQADVIRRDSWDKIKTGDPKKVAVGLKNLVLYATALSAVTIPSDAIKNWIMGRPLGLDKADYVENFTRNFGLSRYTMNQTARSTTPGKAIVEAAGSMVTPPAFSVGKTLGEGLSEPKKLVPFVPLVGRAIYNRELGGNEKAVKQQAIQDRLDARDAAESRNPELKVQRLRKEELRKQRAAAKQRSTQ